MQQLREEKTNFAYRLAMNKGTDKSINEAKQNELVFLNHCQPIKERKKNKAYKEASFKKVLKMFFKVKQEIEHEHQFCYFRT